jgi:hypothetical protein
VKRAWADAARVEEVRDAARGWAHAKAIDPPTLSAIEAAYPETRLTLHPAWRVLIFLLGNVAIGAFFGGAFMALSGGIRAFQWPALIFALVLAVATEFLRGSRLSGTGADAATSFQSLVFLVVAAALFLEIRGDAGLTILLAIACAAAALAAWRWGFWFYAMSAAACGYILVGRMPFARLLWIVLSAVVMALTYRRWDSPSIAPPHRRSLAAVFAVSSAALYTALNLFALDRFFVERIRGPWFGRLTEIAPVSGPLRLGAALATAVFPVLFLLWGIRSRRRLLLGIGIASAILSASTFRYYFPIGPRWAWLTACGAVLVAGAMWANRRLRNAPGGAWRGLTAAPLYSVETAGISPLGAIVGAHVATPASPEPERGGFSGGGGGFGGGGASGQY